MRKMLEIMGAVGFLRRRYSELDWEEWMDVSCDVS